VLSFKGHDAAPATQRTGELVGADALQRVGDVAAARASATPPLRRWIRRLGYALAAIAVLVAAAWVAVPPIARWQLETRLGEYLDRRTTVESVSFNPFALRLTAQNVVIASRDGTEPLLALDSIVADVSAASIRCSTR
jgi:hypothetical protein